MPIKGKERNGSKWKIGVVERLIQGQDGVIRGAQFKWATCSGGLRITNPSHEANREDPSSVKVTMPSIEKIVPQTHEVPDDFNHRQPKLQL